MRRKLDPAIQIAQLQAYHQFKNSLLVNSELDLSEYGYSVFSQFDEDGMLLLILAVIGMGNRNFIDLGADDGVNSNCANLYFHFGWHGLFVDRDWKRIEIGKRFYSRYPHRHSYPPNFVTGKVTPDNVNEIIEAQGFKGEVQLLSIDLDGTDYWVWKAIEVIEPKIVIIETHKEFGHQDLIVPYEMDSRTVKEEHPFYKGASAKAMVKLGAFKGYRLIGANRPGFNFIFVKKNLASDVLKTISIEQAFAHPSIEKAISDFEKVKDWNYQKDDLQ